MTLHRSTHFSHLLSLEICFDFRIDFSKGFVGFALNVCLVSDSGISFFVSKIQFALLRFFSKSVQWENIASKFKFNHIVQIETHFTANYTLYI